MEANIIQLATGALGGLVGGNIFGALFQATGMGLGSRSLIGLVGGALAVQFFGPDVANLAGDLVGSYDPQDALAQGTALSNLVAGTAGGAALAIVMGILNGLFGRD